MSQIKGNMKSKFLKKKFKFKKNNWMKPINNNSS